MELIKILLAQQLVQTLLIFFVASLIYLIIKGTIKRISKFKMSNVDEARKKTLLGLIINIIKYLFMVIGFIMILNVWGVNTSAILASLGAMSLVIGLAFQDTLKDFLAGFFIILEKQYDVGDFVKVDDFRGSVISLGLKTTRIRAYTGEIKIVSNKNITSVINYSDSDALAIIDVQVAYEEDLDKVEKVLKDLCVRFKETLPNLSGDVTLLGVTALESSGVNYRIIAETVAMGHFEVQRIMLKEIKMEFDKQGITIPYNQVVVRNV